jgi:plastocyanin
MTRRAALYFCLVLATVTAIVDGFAAETLVVSQKKRTFNPGEIAIHRGDTLNIVNDDQFTHQIYVDSPSFKFESDESDPGGSVKLTFPEAGAFEVHCHIHPKMLLQVTVQ